MYPAGRFEEILAITGDQARLERTPVHDFMAMLSASGEGGIKDTGLQKAANSRRGEGER
jgi:hypothetical protein